MRGCPAVLLSCCPPASVSAASCSVTAPGPQALHVSTLPAALPVCPASVPDSAPWGGTAPEKQQQKPSGWPSPVFHGFCSTPFTWQMRARPPAPLQAADATCQALTELACTSSPPSPCPTAPSSAQESCGSGAPAPLARAKLGGYGGSAVGCRGFLQPIAAQEPSSPCRYLGATLFSPG